MNFLVPRSIPLAQTITGVPPAIAGPHCRDGAHRLRGDDKEDHLRAQRLREVGGDRHAVVDPHSGQEQAFALLRELLRVGGVLFPSVTLRPARAQVNASARCRRPRR